MSRIRFVDNFKLISTGGDGGDSSISSSYALSASHADFATSASYAEYAVSASHEITKEVSSSYADTASLALSGNGPFTGSFTGSFFGNGSGVFSGSFSGSIPDAYQIISGSVSASISPDNGLRINSPVDITMPSGSVFTIHEPDIDQQNRLDFRFDQGNPMLEIASRSTTSSLYLRTNQTENGLLFDSSGKIKYIVSGTTYAVKLTTAGFVPNAPAQLNLGDYNRRWKDLYVNNGNKISFGVSDNSNIDLVSFRHTVGTNTLVMSGSSDVLLDIKGVVSASRFTVSASADSAPGYTFWNNSTTGMLSNSPTNLKFQIDGTSSPELEMTTGQATFRVPVSLTDNEISNVSRIRNLGSITGSGDNLPIQGSIEVTNITASNNISASNNLFTKQLYVENNLAIDYDFSHNCISFGNVSDCLNLLGTSITASGNLSSSATSTASFGTYLGDGSQLTGIETDPFPYSGSAIISSSGATASLTLEGSGSTVFDVIGSQGTLFSVDDDLSGTIFTANDISGLPILEASASGEVYIGKSPQSLYTTAVISSTTAATTQSIFGLSTSSYDGAFFDYTVQSGSDARAGSIMSVWNGGNISFTETTTTDIGNTTDFNLIVHISQSQAQIASHATNAGYKIKTIIRSI